MFRRLTSRFVRASSGRIELPTDFRATREPVRYERVEAAFEATVEDQTAACVLAALLYRHTQQSSLPIDLLESKRCLTFEMHPDARPGDGGSAAFARSNVAVGRAEKDHDLTLRLAAGMLSLRYDATRFARARMEELLAQYVQLLAAVLAQPEATFGSHSLVTERARSLLPNPGAPIARPDYPLVHEAFFAWASRTPDAIALREDGRDYSYRELAECSTELARRIASTVQPGEVVAVTGQRCFALVAAMLGVFQSGAVLLTLDPKLPIERRRVMAARARLLIGDDDLGIERLGTKVGELPAVSHDAPAYLFFTSGSTGTPKAVLGSHRGLAHFLAWQRETFAIGPGDIASQLTALSFDVVLRDMFLALTSGATLSLPRECDVIEPARILSWLERERITVLHVVPSLMRLWLNHVPEGADLRALRRVFFAGEPLMDVLVARFREVFGADVQVMNLYGPTETTLAKCCFVVPNPALPGVQPIGRPMRGAEVLMLNAQGALCGLHEVGQIAIRTPYRSFGYLDNPEANAKAFVPFAGDVVYLSGASGRYRSDGSLEILGRIDNQVKIRGVRIEPGEIEATLARHPAVRESAVVAREDGQGGKYLAAYVVLKSASGVADLRSFLRAQLSEVMVPAAFVILPALPLNANGKVDRKALPAPERTKAAKQGPRTERERELVAIWQEALAFEGIGVDESFYDLGGDSLTAVRVMLRMRALGLDEQVCRGILQGRTIEELAAQLDGPTQVSPQQRMRTLLNVLRGSLLGVMIVGHFWPGIGRRMPALAHYDRWFEALWNWGTPGFALAFGVTLGFVYLPLYQNDRSRVRALLGQSAVLVGVGAAVFTAARVVMGQLMTDQHHLNPLRHVSIFYFLALLTCDWWLRWTAASRRPIATALGLALGFQALHLGLQSALGVVELSGPGVIAIGKYGYFGMASGVLLGFALGQRLRADMDVDAKLYARLGALGMFVGALLSLREPSASAWLHESVSPSAWRWLFYGGVTLWVMVALSYVLDELPRESVLVRVMTAFGQLSFPLFLLHMLARDLGNLATVFGAPSAVRFALEFGSFFGVTVWAVRKTYLLYYGSTPSAPQATLVVARDSIIP